MKRLIISLPYCIIAVIFAGIVFVSAVNSAPASVVSDDAPLIIIDAGHGGKDGGAVASDGTQEQYINLDIALKLNKKLNDAGYKTLLTRKDDNSIHDSNLTSVREQKVSDIHNRLKIIESNPGCIFVSIHQNYFTESRYNGAQVFYSPNNEKSSLLASCIQKSIVTDLQPDNTRQIKESGSSIYILYHSKEPSVLVECGFLSNTEETAKLNDENYRTQMADSVCKGIINYINGAVETEESSAVNP